MSVFGRLVRNPHLGLLLRLVVGATFVYAAIYKIQEPAVFAEGVLDYHLLPPSLVIPFAVIMPWAEVIAGVFLVAGWLRRGSAFIIVLMLVAFIVAIIAAIARGINISCGCFHATTEGTRVAWITLWRDVLLVIATLPVMLMPRTTFELLPGGFKRRPW
jgi:putative oxidoreductase